MSLKNSYGNSPKAQDIDSDEPPSDDDENDGLTKEEIRRKSSGFWTNPRLEDNEPCQIRECTATAINRCVYTYTCSKGCDRVYCEDHRGYFSVQNRFGKNEFQICMDCTPKLRCRYCSCIWTLVACFITFVILLTLALIKLETQTKDDDALDQKSPTNTNNNYFDQDIYTNSLLEWLFTD